MIVISAHSPVYSNATHTTVDLMVQFEGCEVEIPFTASPVDTTEHGQAIYEKCLSGQYGTVGPFVPTVTPPKQFTSLEFLDLFTDEEQLAVAGAAMVSAAVKLWYDRVLAASYISLADSRTAAGLQALVSAGLLEESRRVAITGQML